MTRAEIAIVCALALGACGKGCGEPPRAKGTPSGAIAKVVYTSPSSTGAAVERLLARHLAALAPAFYRVATVGADVVVEIPQAEAARVKGDVDAAPRLDVYAVDETTPAFEGRAKDAPFPSLAEGNGLYTPIEHEAPLARFVATIAPPAARVVLLGVRAGGDSFARTFVVVTPASIGGEHVARVVAEDGGGAFRVAIEFDDEGRARLAALSRAQGGRRVAFAIDDRVVAAPETAQALDGARVVIALAKGATRADADALAARFTNGARSAELSARDAP